jgi:hypothetical protein
MTTIDLNVTGGTFDNGGSRSTGPTFPRPFPPPTLPERPTTPTPTLPLGPLLPDVPRRNDIA